jgi:NAD(P)-dependent dehydrogenase (short-subunit alcohol dehydrogenase family)
LCIELDVTSKESVDAAAKRVKEEWNALDILVNNAGFLEPVVPLTESDVEKYWRSWEVNMKGPYLVSRACLPLLLKSEVKIIINVSSIGAHMTLPGASAYQTAKLALLRFTEFIDNEYGKEGEGVIAIAIHPGGEKTDLANGMPEAFHVALIDKPELAGNTVVWLTGERRVWLSGRYVSVNWDVEELEQRREDILRGDLLKVRMDVGFGA